VASGSSTDQEVLNKVINEAEGYRVNVFIIGLPQAFEESHNKIRKEIKQFAKELAKYSGSPIRFVDESYSTYHAEENIKSLGVSSRRSKGKKDSLAAAHFLQNYLDEYNKRKT
jgi:putative Holliday junction resolvase